MRIRITAEGQSAVEFSLIAPFLFLFFFCVIQTAYTAYVSLAVQRAALAVARKASLSPGENSAAFKTQLTLSLLPLVRLNSKTLPTILEAQYLVTVSKDNKKVTAQVRYPMPIWIPIVRNLFGETLTFSPASAGSPEGLAVQNLISLLNHSNLNLSLQSVRLPVRWITFEETTYNESYSAE